MVKSKQNRKQVSFQQPNNEEISNPTSSADEVPNLTYPILTLPFHNLLTLIGMFGFGLASNVQEILSKGLISLITLQVVYDYLLIKNSANSNVKTKSKRRDENVSLLIVSSILVSIVISIPLYFVLILFGSPLSSHLVETYLLSLHLSILIFNPILVIFKLDYQAFFNIFKVEKIYRLILTNQVLAGSFLTIIGTWIGVIPIPLDWDRDWQQWPITLLTGAYLGSFVGSLISLLI